jgi:hypothetical protein
LADEPTGAPATAEPAAGATPEAAPKPDVAAAAATAPPDWDALDSSLAQAYEADPKTAADRLKKHRAVAGIAGSLAEQRFDRMRQESDAAAETRARQQAHEELVRMAEERPLEFADKFRTHAAAEEQRARIMGVEANAQKKILEQVGAAFHEFEEWGQITDDERGRLAAALKNVPPDKLLAAFNKTAVDIVADRRAEKRLADRLPKEQEAWKKQWEAERLASERSPDLRRPSGATQRPLNMAAMSDEDFNDWYERAHPNAKRTGKRALGG